MAISPGIKLGSYEITGPIGAGGMGEVYRARDTKLDRNVAIKVLPEKFAEDGERLARFEREAKLLASLNHPNIASIYGFEENALVMELVEGPTLAERIQKGPIPIEEALAIAKQIADALEAGHEAGIIHRDLKPANIKVREDGTVKVLDYGLAKALEGDAPNSTDSELSQSPTLTRHGTQMGVILGTAAYMSPEQAKGKRVDGRTDVWAFGAVVYEMLTGKRAFAADDVSETLAHVLTKEPDWEAMPVGTPAALLQAVRVCLTKDAKRRARDIADVCLAMEGIFDTQTEVVRAPVGRRPSIGIAGTLAVLLGIVTGVAVWRMTRPVEIPRPVTRLSLVLPPDDSLSRGADYGHALALSSDGTRLVYHANQQLYLRAMDQTVSTPIPGSEGARGSPFFSPDGEWVVFYSQGELKKLAVQGGAPVTLCEAATPHGTRWGADNEIVFGERGAGIKSVSADGGACEVLIPIAESEGLSSGPQVLPRGESVLFTLGEGLNTWDDAQIVVESLETGTRRVLIERGRDARYLPTGHLVYVLNGTLFAVPFDVRELEVTGGPIPIAERVATSRGLAAAHFSVSDTGTLAYLPVASPANKLTWVDRDGKEELLAAEPQDYRFPRISPDGARLAIDVGDFREMDIWIWDFSRETLNQLTYGPGEESYPVWTPDGGRVAFSSESDRGVMQLFWKAADGSGTAEQLNESEHFQFPDAFTPDGRQLVYTEIKTTLADRVDQDLGVHVLDGTSAPILETEFSEKLGILSPDGRWLAYQSDASGQFEVYVRGFPNVEEGRWQISRGGGASPLWAPDGRELFYWTPGAGLMVVEVETDPSFVSSNPEELFRGYYSPSDGMGGRDYDISPDGKRFLMIKEGVDTDSTEFVVVVNWFEELRRLVPTEN